MKKIKFARMVIDREEFSLELSDEDYTAFIAMDQDSMNEFLQEKDFQAEFEDDSSVDAGEYHWVYDVEQEKVLINKKSSLIQITYT